MKGQRWFLPSIYWREERRPLAAKVLALPLMTPQGEWQVSMTRAAILVINRVTSLPDMDGVSTAAVRLAIAS